MLSYLQCNNMAYLRYKEEKMRTLGILGWKAGSVYLAKNGELWGVLFFFSSSRYVV